MLALAKRFFGPYRLQLMLGPLTKTLEVVFDLVTPLVVAWMIDSGVRKGDVSVVVKGGVALAVMAALGFSVTLICQKMASVASQGVATDLRRALFSKVNELSFADLDAFGTPSLVTRLTSDVNAVQTAISMLIRQVIRWPVLAVGSLVCALAIDWQLGLVFCVCMPLIALVFYVVMKRSVPYFAGMQVKLDRLGRLVRETFEGLRPIRAFGREAFERERFRAAAQDQAATAVAVGRLSALLAPATFVVMNLGIVALLFFGGGQVGAGRLEQGQVMAMIGYMNQLLVSIVFVANLVVIFTKASASAARIQEVLDTEPSLTDKNNEPQDVDPEAPILEFRGVSFTYPGGARAALAGVDLALGRGETLGVIGGTGSGKTTLVSLVPRFYDATQGEVRVAGRDVRAYPFSQLRSLVSVVPQKASLVSGTVRENLCWRKEDASDAELWAALESAQGAEFVRSKSQGLDEPVEAGGRNFSGGQRQRLTIARALVGSPSLVILDDSASALDYATDLKLRRALRNLPGDPACLIVSQRVSSVRHADKICVLDQGRVVGLGTHDELAAGCAVYREICATQLKDEEAAA